MELSDWGGSNGGYKRLWSSYGRGIGEPRIDSPLTVGGNRGGGDEYLGDDII